MRKQKEIKKRKLQKSLVKASLPKQNPKQKVNPTINRVVKTLGGLGGSLIGLGSDSGSKLADSAHHLFKEITGWGDYNVSSNSLIDQGAPMFKPSDRIMRIRHREFISDLKCSAIQGKFELTPYKVNPSNPLLFPWLSTIAHNFQQYRFRGLIFTFESNSGNSVGSTNTSLGTVIMSTNYNIHAPRFTNKQQMETHEFTTSCKPSSNMMHPFECSPKEQVCQHYFIENRAVGQHEDRKFYDVANFEVATVGMQGTSVNLGELWCSYDVELLKPRKDDTVYEAHFELANADIDTPTPFKTGAFLYGDDSIVSFSKTAAVLTFNSGFYGLVRVMVMVDSPGSLSGSINIVSLSSTITESTTFIGDSTGYFTAGNSDTRLCCFELNVNGGGDVTLSPLWFSGPDAGATASVFINTSRRNDVN